MNQLLKTIQQLTAQNKRVLFLDIGGDIGTYSIAVANRFPTEAVNIICFEPIPDSCALIRENIQRNQQGDRIELIEVALMDKAHDELKISLNTLAPGSSSITGTGQEIIVKGDTLDNLLLDRIHNYDAIVFKIDVEGAEKAVLTGAKQILATPTESILMIEDFIDTSIIPFLEQSGWNFQQKLTDYNSWWTQV